MTWAFETELDYRCGRAKAFGDGSGGLLMDQRMTCGWDGVWSPTAVLKTCICRGIKLCVASSRPYSELNFIGTHCDKPPAPTNGTELEPVWDGTSLIDFDSGVNYTCKRGQKFEVDFDRQIQNATCRDPNVWDIPTEWLKCVESKPECKCNSLGNYVNSRIL